MIENKQCYMSTTLVCITCGVRATLRLLSKLVAMFLRYGLSFGILLHSYDYLSLGVIFFQIPEGLRGIAQRVRSVDDRCDLP